MPWIKITKDNIKSLKIGDKVRYHNGYTWEETLLDAFAIQRGFFPTGLGGETCDLLYPMFGGGVYVWRNEEDSK